jgi:Domain of unknown function (DUF397)
MGSSQGWFKSSYSGGANTECVEVRLRPDGLEVRDSKDLEGPVLAFPAAAWASFTSEIRNGRLHPEERSPVAATAARWWPRQLAHTPGHRPTVNEHATFRPWTQFSGQSGYNLGITGAGSASAHDLSTEMASASSTPPALSSRRVRWSRGNVSSR